MEYYQMILLVFSVCLMINSIPTILCANNATMGTIMVNGTTLVAQTDQNYICLTLDIWPHDECRWRDLCVWDGHASVLNLDLSLPILNKAVQSFKSLRIRVGGSLQDKLIYDIGDGFEGHCNPFQAKKGLLFDFSEGCLYMKRWDDLNNFFNNTGAIVTFGLNALLGRHNTKGMQWEGDWNYINAEALIQYTIEKNYQIHSWEFGNELTGFNSIGASVTSTQYAKDVIKLREVIDRLYNNSQLSKPLIVAPSTFFDEKWYDDFATNTGSGIVDIVTHHIYNMGAGNDPKLIYRFVNPTYLSKESNIFEHLENVIQKNAPWATAWVGEAGGAYQGGSPHISDTFINGFWYLDQLGMAALYNTKVYCRQTLIGGFYGVLKPATLLPTPDYYGALLFHRLMGPGVLKVDNNISSYLRSYAHCARGRPGITILFINLSNTTDFTINIENHINISLHKSNQVTNESTHLKHRRFPKGESKLLIVSRQREEYHLTPKDGLVRSSIVLLNGTPLETTKDGDIPNLTPVYRQSNSSIHIVAWSIAFIVIPDFVAPACK